MRVFADGLGSQRMRGREGQAEQHGSDAEKLRACEPGPVCATRHAPAAPDVQPQGRTRETRRARRGDDLSWGVSGSSLPAMLRVCLTVDVEPDCPPYLQGWRGIEQGMPRLLALLDAEGVPATFFTTGESALRYPDVVRTVVARGHELGCHGHTHRAFTDLSPDDAWSELHGSTQLLRTVAPVRSFRAPYLRFPVRYLSMLEALGFELDSSQGRYKPDYLRAQPATTLTRVPASMTSSALRLPTALRDFYLRVLRPPVVLFVHPWEFVDMTDEAIPWHCRLGTGEHALASLAAAIRTLKERGASFSRMDALLGHTPAAS
jgi:peptidoglycan/xylan/chitin deacetylase (PgdA/CDA1 family)